MRSSLAESFRQAFAGLGDALRTQRNLQIHAAAAVLIVVLILLLHLSPLEAAVLVLAMSTVVAAELLNTAIEVLVDHLVGPEELTAAGRVKDVAAAAVLVAAIGAAAVGVLILLPRIR